MKHETHNMKVTFKKGEEVLQSKAMLAARTSAATMEEVKALNAMEAPVGKEVSLDNEAKAVQLLCAALDYMIGLRATVRPEGVGSDEAEALSLHSRMGNELYALEEAIVVEAKRQLDDARAKLKRRVKNRKKKVSKKQKAIMHAIVDDVD